MRTELRCFSAFVTLGYVTSVIASTMLTLEKYTVSNRILVSVEETKALSILTRTESKDMLAETEPIKTQKMIGAVQSSTTSPSLTPSTPKYGISSIEAESDIISKLTLYSELELTPSAQLASQEIASRIEPINKLRNYESIITLTPQVKTDPISQIKNTSAPELKTSSERTKQLNMTSINLRSTWTNQIPITEDLNSTSSDFLSPSLRTTSQIPVSENISDFEHNTSLEFYTHSLPFLRSSEVNYFTMTELLGMESNLSDINVVPIQSTTKLETTEKLTAGDAATLSTTDVESSTEKSTGHTAIHITPTFKHTETFITSTFTPSSDVQSKTKISTEHKTTLSTQTFTSSSDVHTTTEQRTENSRENTTTLSATTFTLSSNVQTTTEQKTTENPKENTTILTATTFTPSLDVQTTTEQRTTENPMKNTTTLNATTFTPSSDIQTTTEQRTTKNARENTTTLSATTCTSSSDVQTTTNQRTTKNLKENTTTLSATTFTPTSDVQTTTEQRTTENSKETATLSATTFTPSLDVQTTTEQRTMVKTTTLSATTFTSSSEQFTTTVAISDLPWPEPTTAVGCNVSTFGGMIGQYQPRENQYAEFACQWLTNGACDRKAVTWKRDGFMYKDSDRTKIRTEYYSNRTISALWLLPVRARDSGTITCSFFNVEHALKVTVLEKPQVIIAPQIVAVEHGTSVSILCNITNANKANVSSTNITWCVNGTEYAGTNGIKHIKYKDTSSVLTVPASNANYSCGVMQNTTINELCNNSPTSTVLIYDKEISVCKNESEAGLHWETTPEGREQITACREGYSGTVRRKCSKGGNWLPPNLLGCIKKAITDALENLDALENGEGDHQEVINDVLSTLTTSTDDTNGNSVDRLSSGDLSKTTAVLDKILNITSNETSINETTFVGVLDNLLSVKNSETWKSVYSESEGTDSASSIMKTVTTLGKVIAKGFDGNKTVVVRKQNIELEIARTAGYLTFESEQTGDDVKQKIDYNKKGDKTFTAALYKTISSVLPDRTLDTGSKKISFASEVLSLDILSDNITINAENPVILTFETKRFAKKNNLTEYIKDCVWWDFKLEGWNASGCEMFNKTCRCNHLTNFAVLMSPIGLISQEQSKRLRIISLIGCCISILSSVVTIIVYARLWRYVASNRSKLLLNLCAALTVAYILFIAGIDKTDNDDACTALTALMHYFFLCTFCLMLAEGIDILISVVIVFSTTSKLKWLLFMGWGVPTIVVSVTVAITYKDEYHSQHYCWLTLTNGVLYSFVGPVVGIIVINIIILIGVLRALYSAKIVMSRSRKQKIVAGVRSVCILLPVLGITWLFGIMSVNDDLIVFQYLFAIINSLQGLFIFLFYVVFNKQVRKAINDRVKKHETRTQDSRFLSSKSKKLSQSSTTGNIQESQQSSIAKKKLGKQYELYGFNLPRANFNVRRKTYDTLYSDETCLARL